jgi:hypothetical protein
MIIQKSMPIHDKIQKGLINNQHNKTECRYAKRHNAECRGANRPLAIDEINCKSCTFKFDP